MVPLQTSVVLLWEPWVWVYLLYVLVPLVLLSIYNTFADQKKKNVEPVIKSHKLQQFVVNPVVPPRYLTEDDRIADRVNPEYET